MIITFVFSIAFYALLASGCVYLFRSIPPRSMLRENKDTRTRGLVSITAIFALYTVLACAYFMPCILRFSTHIIGPAEDNLSHLWDIWWVHKVLSTPGAHLSYTRYLFYPEGASLLFHAFSFYNLALSVPLRLLLNYTATYNLLVLVTYPLSGLGAYMLVRYLTGSRFAAVIGGFVFAFSPFHYARALHHIEIASMQFVPFFVLYFMKSVRGSDRRDIVLMCLFFLLTSLCSWYYMIFSLYFMALAYMYLAIRNRKVWAPRTAGICLLAAGITAVILSPWISRMVIYAARTGMEISPGHNQSVADLLGFVFPDPYHWLAGMKWVRFTNFRFTGSDWEKTVYLGIVSVVVVAWAFRGTIKDTAKYFLGMAAFAVLAMGEYLHVLGKELPVVLPYALIKHVPLLASARSPSRAVVYVYLFWSVIVSLAVLYVISRFRKQGGKALAGCLLAALIIADYSVICDTMTETYLPGCYNVIMKDSSGDFGILDLPWNYQVNERYMMYQVYHGIPIAQGALARKPEETFTDGINMGDLITSREELVRRRIKYIVVHWKEFYTSAPPVREIYDEISWMRRELVGRLISVYEDIYHDDNNIVLKVY